MQQNTLSRAPLVGLREDLALATQASSEVVWLDVEPLLALERRLVVCEGVRMCL